MVLLHNLGLDVPAELAHPIRPNKKAIQKAIRIKVVVYIALDAIFLYQILGIAHKADVSTPGSAHHPNLSHMLYGCWGYWGY